MPKALLPVLPVLPVLGAIGIGTILSTGSGPSSGIVPVVRGRIIDVGLTAKATLLAIVPLHKLARASDPWRTRRVGTRGGVAARVDNLNCGAHIEASLSAGLHIILKK
jgi:hypothetical protein